MTSLLPSGPDYRRKGNSMPDELIYDGGFRPSLALRLNFPLGRVEANQSRRKDGTGFYDVHTGRNGFYPDPGSSLVYFSGEKIPHEDVSFAGKMVASDETKKTTVWTPAPPVKVEQTKSEWKPDPPKKV
jgi:hypothetical protein